MLSEQGRVVVKARPTFVPAEQEALGDTISILSEVKVALTSGKDREAKEFTADGVYLPNDGDEAVYQHEVQPLVQSVHQGFNATIFAYGASGSGKTYTMLGNKDNPGLANRIIDDVFALYDPRTCTVAVAIEELYNENFTDLVAALPGQAAAQQGLATPRRSAKQLSSSSKHPARPLEGKEVRSSRELKQLVHAALRKRKTAATVLNESSSRSHAIITLTLLQRKRVNSSGAAVSDDDNDSSPASSPSASRAASRRCSSSGSIDANSSSAALDSPRSEVNGANDDLEGGVFTYLTGKLYLVDLAGSENIKRSGAEGKQLVEAGDINKSLCHLKTVIDQVFQGKKVPTYRNSKLTFKLQDALGGGNSKLLVIACINTARENLALTKETLRFAEMARAIKNKPTVNRELKDQLITRLQQQIEELQDQLAKVAQHNKGVGSDKLLLQQLNAVEAAYAELQEAMEAKEAKWAADAEGAQQRSTLLQQQLAAVSRELCATTAREAALQQQQAADQAEIQELRQALQEAQAKQADTAAQLGSAETDLQLLGGQCEQLQQQLATQQAAADTANELCAEQQQQAQLLQQQLKAKADEATALQQQLQQEVVARTAAQQSTAQLAEHLEQEKRARAAAEHNSEQLAQKLQHDADAAAAAHRQLGQQLAEVQQQVQVQKQARLAAETLLAAVGDSMQQLAEGCSNLQQQLHRQQMQHARASGSCNSCITGAQVVHQQLDVGHKTSIQLRQELCQQQELLQAAREAAAEQAAQLEREQDAWQCARDTDRAIIAELQQQTVDDKAAHAAQAAIIAQLQKQAADQQAAHAAAVSEMQQRHAAQVAEIQQRHAEQLEASRQHSVQKLLADKLRCKEHMALQVHGLMAEAQSLSEALSVNVVSQLPETPTGMKTPTSAALAAVAESSRDMQLPEQQQQQRKQNGRYQQLPEQPEEDDENEQQQEDEVAEQQEEVASAGELEEGEGDDGDSEYGLEPSLAGASSNGDSGMSQQASPSLAHHRTDSPVDNSSCSLASAYLEQSDEPAVQRSSRQQHGAARSSGSSVRVSLPTLPIAGLQEAAAAEAEGMQVAGARAGSWPIEYRADGEVDMATAQRIFAEVAGEELKVAQLQAFLKLCRLGGQLHSSRLPCGKKKLKQHLIQDMLGYHQHTMQLRSCSSSGASGRHSSFSASPDGACSIACRRVSEASGASGASASTAGLQAQPSSSASAQEAVIDLCTPDTTKAAAAAAAADGAQSGSKTPRGSRQHTPRTPHSFSLSSSKGAAPAAAAAASPASGGGIWGWLTPRSSKKKHKAVTAAAAAGSSSGGLAVRTDCMSPRYDCDIAASPSAGADTLQRRAGPAALAESVVSDGAAAVSSLAGSGSRSAVEMLMLQMQSDPMLGSPGPAVSLEALIAAGYGSSAADSSSSAGDVRVLQQGGSLAQRSSWRHTQARAAAKSSRR